MPTNHLVEHTKCEHWHNMIDFPDAYGWDISRYYLANYCKECDVWFPAGTVGKICPCCHAHIKFKPIKYSLTREVREVFAGRMEEFKKANPGWTLLKGKIMKEIIDLKIVKGEI